MPRSLPKRNESTKNDSKNSHGNRAYNLFKKKRMQPYDQHRDGTATIVSSQTRSTRSPNGYKKQRTEAQHPIDCDDSKCTRSSTLGLYEWVLHALARHVSPTYETR